MNKNLKVGGFRPDRCSRGNASSCVFRDEDHAARCRLRRQNLSQRDRIYRSWVGWRVSGRAGIGGNPTESGWIKVNQGAFFSHGFTLMKHGWGPGRNEIGKGLVILSRKWVRVLVLMNSWQLADGPVRAALAVRSRVNPSGSGQIKVNQGEIFK